MLSNESLAAAIKSGATNEEVYELVGLIFGKFTNETYFSLLKRNKRYESLLAETDEAEKKLNQEEIPSEIRNSIERFIELSEEMEDESRSVLYLSIFIDSYRFFKALGLINC